MNNMKKLSSGCVQEINKCLLCKEAPCKKACPAGIDIPKVMYLLKNNNTEQALLTITKKNIFPMLCSKLCDHNRQCLGACVRNKINDPVAFHQIEKELSENIFDDFTKIENYIPVETDLQKNKIRILIIGGGVTGLTCALILNKKGYEVTIYEKETSLGGMINLIPKSRYKSNIFTKLTFYLLSRKVKIQFNKEISNTQIIELENEYDYIIYSIGASKYQTLNITSPNIYQAISILKQKALNEKVFVNKKIIIIGLGNVALDTACSLVKENDVTIIYRRNIKFSPANKDEINNCIKLGVKIIEQLNPLEIIVNNEILKGVICNPTILNDSGKITEIKYSEKIVLPCDIIIEAIGSTVDKELFYSLYQGIENEQTFGKNNKVYFGGDFYHGSQTIVKAMKAGYDISFDIINNLK